MSENSGAALHKFLCIYKNQTNPQVQCIYLYSESNNTEELFDKVIDGHFEFNSPFWDDISDSATDLITHMLEVNPETRITAEDVLAHEWIIVSYILVLNISNLHKIISLCFHLSLIKIM